MKKNFFKPALLAAAFLSIMSCDNDDDIIDTNTQVDLTIQGVTYDQNGFIILSDVDVSLLGDTNDITGEDGAYRFSNRETGTHLLRFEKEGYANMTQEITLEASEFTPEDITHSTAIEMYEANETLTTTLTYSNTSNSAERMLAANAEVTITFDVLTTTTPSITSRIFFENARIETTTDENGVLTLDGLPNGEVSITAEFDSGTDLYRGEFNTAGIIGTALTPSNVDSNYNLTLFNQANDLFLVDTNVIDNATELAVTDFTDTDNITFTFSENLDIESSVVTLRKTSNGNRDILIETTTSGDTVTIDPEGDNLEAGNSYEVFISVISTDGDTYTNVTGFDFTVEGEFNNTSLDLSGVNINLDEIHDDTNEILINTNTFTIEFLGLEDVPESSYEVYGRYNNGTDMPTDEFILLGSSQNLTADSTQPQSDDAIEYDIFLNGNTINVADDVDAGDYFDNNAILTIKVRAIGGTNDEFSNELDVRLGDFMN